MSDSRIKNSKRNMIFSVIGMLSSIILSFITKSLIIYRFGVEYIGVQSLVSSILGVLNFSELGFGTAIVLLMYKPIAENNTDEVNKLLYYYRKIYRFIGIFIIAVGTAITPLVPNLISGKVPDGLNLYIIYYIYIINTAISYLLFAYKASLLEANQRQDLTKKAYTISNIAIAGLQVIVIYISNNFYVFSACIIIGTISRNIISSYLCSKYFPQYHCESGISKDTKKNILLQVGGLAIVNLGAVSRNSFDSIVISKYLGLRIVGLYSNYFLVYNSVYTGITAISNAMQASIGNSIVTKTKEENFDDMLKLQFIFSWLACWCVSCMAVLYQPFMLLWIGSEGLLEYRDMILFCLYFYIMSMVAVRNLYLYGVGLWPKVKLATVLEASGNLLLNIILGYFFGVTGVLFASVITMFFFNFIMINHTLFKYYFVNGIMKFYLQMIGYSFVTLGIVIISVFTCNQIPDNTIIALLVRLLISTLLSLAIWFLIYHKTKAYKNGMDLVRRAIKT